MLYCKTRMSIAVSALILFFVALGEQLPMLSKKQYGETHIASCEKPLVLASDCYISRESIS